MLLTKRNDVIRALTPDGSDHALREPVAPRARSGRDDVRQPECIHFALKLVSVDAVAVADQVRDLRRRFVAKRLDELLRRPLRRRVSRHVHVQDAPRAVVQHDEHEQVPEGRRRHDEEVARDRAGHVVAQERRPALSAPRWSVAHAVLVDGGLGDFVSEQSELVSDPRRAPKRVLTRQPLDERHELPTNRRATDRARLRLAPPVGPPSRAVPAHDRVGLHDEQRLAPRAQQPQHADPEDAIAILKLRALHAAPQHRNLLTQRQVLEHESLAI